MRPRSALAGAALAAALILVPAPSRGQAPATLDVLLAEVRLLRQALERQAGVHARTQLVVGQLTLQDQRLARARGELGRAEGEVQSLSQDVRQTQGVLAEMTQALDAVDATRRPEMEREVRVLTQRVRDQEAARAAAEGRRGRALQSVAAEEARYEELERRLDELDRELLKAAR